MEAMRLQRIKFWWKDSKLRKLDVDKEHKKTWKLDVDTKTTKNSYLNFMALLTYFYFKALNNFLKMQDQLPATSTILSYAKNRWRKYVYTFNEECMGMNGNECGAEVGEVVRCFIQAFFPRSSIRILMSFKIFELSSFPHPWGELIS